MDITSERSYPTPYANSAILPLLLLSLSSQRMTPKVTKNIDTEYDYIIVGGGTAGSVVANRISELPCVNVLLLEAGKDPPLLTEVPALSKFFKYTDLDWNYKTVPQKHTGEALLNKQIPLSSGKTLGGSSVINSMVTSRGNPLDYENWANSGADGWSYEDVISYFKKLEDNKDPEYIKNGFHNTGGLLTVHRPRYQSEVKKPLFQAARAIGYKVVDPNALKQTGFYDFQASLRKSQRCSVSKAYLVPAENRTNLHILSKATVRKIVIQNGVTSGVLYDYEGETIEVTARKEVILSAGTFNSAKLLMLSGIGPKKHLEELKIPVVVDLPVGENLQDHCAIPLHFALNSSIPSILMKLINPVNVDQYINTRNGVLSSAGFITALGFQNADEQDLNTNSPSFQIYVEEDTTIIPKLHYGLKPEVYSQVFGKYENKAYITCLSVTLHPRSRGNVKLKSLDPYDPPLIDPNYLKHPNDVKDLVEGLKTCMKLVKTPTMQKLGTVPFETFYPGCIEYKKKEELYFWCLAKQLTISMNNAVGTVKMGRIEDPTTVVDSQLRVKYVKKLRVIDASVMPTITSGDTSIPTIMIAERASDILKSTVDCDDLIAESDVQASIPVISISRDYVEHVPKLSNPALERRHDSNLALEQLKDVFNLYNRDKEDYHRSVTDKLQSRIKDLSYALEDLTPNRRRTSTSSSVDDLIKGLEELKYQLQKNQNQNLDENQERNSYGRNRGNSDLLVKQILSALASSAPKSYPSQSRNTALNDEIPPGVRNQILSIMELILEDRDVSESNSRRSGTSSSQSLPIDAINQILSVLNNPRRKEIHSHSHVIDSNNANEGNSQNLLLNQVISALQVTPHSNNPYTKNPHSDHSYTNNPHANHPHTSNLHTNKPHTNHPYIDHPHTNHPHTDHTYTNNPHTSNPHTSNSHTNHLQNIHPHVQTENKNTSPNDTIQITIQNQLNQILTTVNELRQGPTAAKNETSLPSNATNNDNDKAQEMMSQILLAINDLRSSHQTQININETISTTTPISNSNSQETALNQILKELSELRQNSQQPRQNENNVPTSNPKIDKSNDTILSEIISSINEMKEDIKIAKHLNFQSISDSTRRQGVSPLPEQNIAQIGGIAPVIETKVLQQPSNNLPQVSGLNTVLPPGVTQQGLNALSAATQPVNPYLNLLQGQRTFEAISQMLGRNQGIVQPPVLPPPFMGMPPGIPPGIVPPNRMPPPFPPPFIPPGMPPNPCARTVVMNNINLCNGNVNPQRPLTPREMELCQSLHAATQCQNGNNCRGIPPYLYNYYCNGK